MMTIENLRKLLVSEAKRIVSDEDYYIDYLHTSALFNNSDSFNTLLVHAQSPKATMLYTLAKWNSMGRCVEPNSIATKAISIYHKNAIIDMYDVSDTRLIKPDSTQDLSIWKMNVDEARYVCQAIKNLNGYDNDNNMYHTFKLFIKQQHPDWDENVVIAAAYATCYRLTLNSNFKFAFEDSITLPSENTLKQVLSHTSNINHAVNSALQTSIEFVKMYRSDKPLPERKKAEAINEVKFETVINNVVVSDISNSAELTIDDDVNNEKQNIALLIKENDIISIIAERPDDKDVKKALGGKCKLVATYNEIEFYNGPISKNKSAMIMETSNGIRLVGDTLCYKKGGLSDKDIQAIHAIADNRSITYTSASKQISLFDTDENELSEAARNYIAPSFNTVPMTVIHSFLIAGTDEKNSKLDICVYFMYEHEETKRAEFIKKHLLESTWSHFRGYSLDDKEYVIYVDEDGVHASQSDYFDMTKAIHMNWKTAANTISNLLESGNYISFHEIESAEYSYKYRLAERISFVDRELDVNLRLVPNVARYIYPECVNTIMSTFNDKSNIKTCVAKAEKLLSSGDTNTYSHNYIRKSCREIVERLLPLINDPIKYTAEATSIKFAGSFFISKNEKNHLIISRQLFSQDKFAKYEFFKQHSDMNECSNWLKGRYGTGGCVSTGYSEDHSAKGIIFSRAFSSSASSNVYDTIKIPYSEAANIIRNAINSNAFFTSNELPEAITYFQNEYTDEYKKNEVSDRLFSLERLILELGGTLPVISDSYQPVDEDEATLGNDPAHTPVSDDFTEPEPIGEIDYSAADDSDIKLVIGDVISFDGGKYKVEGIKTSLNDVRISLFDLNSTYPISRSTSKNELLLSGYEIIKPVANVSANEKLNLTDYHSEATISGAKAQYNANVEAIRLLKKIESENRLATAEEQRTLARYCGWGGCANAFDPNKSDWKNEYKELKELLTHTEYAAAQQSSLTAFYTPHYITSAINNKLMDMGVTGGNILEPALGTGAFFAAMPKKMKNNSNLFGVELDELSGRLARQLQQKANIQIAGFENTNYLPNTFDVVISNVPFGDVGIADSKYNKYSFKIHDYFFAKSADLLRPNGVMAMITSSGTLDKQSDTLRYYLAQRCDFIGAVRLPNNTFGGTKAVSDIIFLQKRETPLESIDSNESWHKTGLAEEGYELNQYFIDNPHLILGELKPDTRYGDSRDYTVAPKPETDIVQSLNEALSSFILSREFAYNPAKADVDNNCTLPAPPDARNYTYYIKDEKIYYCENDTLTLQDELKKGGAKYNRIVALDKVRHAYRELIQGQASSCSDERLKELQNALNSEYDGFVSTFGYISNKTTETAFLKDDDYNLLVSLEIKNEETKEVKKSNIFTDRVIRPQVEITEVQTATEALNVSLDRKGKVDLSYMMSIYPNHTEQELINELGDLIYRNPIKVYPDDSLSGYETAFDYLCGNVREKLQIARGAAINDTQYQRNVEALTAVIPEPLQAHEITVKLGAPWIDINDYNIFMYELFQTPRYLMRSYSGSIININRIDYTGEWKINHSRMDKSYTSMQVFGTSRINAYEILERLLNQRQIVVKDRVDDDEKVRYVVNSKETAKAQECARKIKEAWQDWIFATPERREKYVERYNDMYNGIRPRDYSDVRLSYPQMSPNIKLKDHQHTAVARCVFNGNTLLAHCVGAGKTFEMCAATMEKIRLGLIHKACVVVPKHLLYQTASEWQRLYPQAHILVATEKDFAKKNRQRFIARCATGSYDCVMMSYQQFEAVKMSKEYQQSFIRSEMRSLENALNELDKNEDKITVKQLEGAKKRLEVKLSKIIDAKEDILSFEQMGVDSLVVDEAHAYKNCLIPTKISNVSGVSNAHSERSEDMLMKCRWLNSEYGYRNIIFATGTPVSNSMVELYTMQRYLRPDALEKVRCIHFDDWAANFGEVVTQLEMKPTGDGFQMKSRFAKFVNLPELMALYKEFADVVTADMIDLDVPEIKGGKAQIIVAPASEFQKEIMKELSERTELIHNGLVDSRVDNMLKITHEARLLGLDGRAIEPLSENYAFSKVNSCVDNVLKIYNTTADKKGVQIIWSDIAVNSDKGFSVYDYLKEELVTKGVPENEIAKIGDAKTDAQRAELFAQLRSGAKRIVIASTSKLGTGANIQTRLSACHHLDIPWRPSDLEQRNGRILRQGNTFDSVEILHYTTAKTFDAYMLNIITTKQKFISQIMTSQSPVRVCEDVDELVLTYSEFQAVTTGNPLIKEKYELEIAVSQLAEIEAEWQKSRYKIQDDIYKILPQKIKAYESAIVKTQADVDTHKSYETDDFKIVIGNKEYTERSEAADVLSNMIGRCNLTGERIDVGEFMGYKLSLQKITTHMNDVDFVAVLKNNNQYTVKLENRGIGAIVRIENCYKTKPFEHLEKMKQELEKANADLLAAKIEYDKPFGRRDELNAKRQRLIEVNNILAQPTAEYVDDTPSSSNVKVVDVEEYEEEIE